MDALRKDALVYRRIVVPVSGDWRDRFAINLSRAVAKLHGTDLTLVYVVEVPRALPLDADLPRDIEHGEQVLSSAADYARSVGDGSWLHVVTELLQARSAAAAVVDEAIDREADAIVLAASNRLEHGVLTQGETVPYVFKNAPCDVLVVRARSEDEDQA